MLLKKNNMNLVYDNQGYIVYFFGKVIVIRVFTPTILIQFS